MALEFLLVFRVICNPCASACPGWRGDVDDTLLGESEFVCGVCGAARLTGVGADGVPACACTDCNCWDCCLCILSSYAAFASAAAFAACFKSALLLECFKKTHCWISGRRRVCRRCARSGKLQLRLRSLGCLYLERTSSRRARVPSASFVIRRGRGNLITISTYQP